MFQLIRRRRKASSSASPRREDGKPKVRGGRALHVGEIYGFVGAITVSVFAVLYFFWAYTPESVLHALGIYYYPSKYWALAIPVWISASVVASFWMYEGYSLAQSHPLHSVYNIHDDFCRWERDLAEEQKEMPFLYEMPITQVNAMLFD
jgi:phosphatidylinositol glycan class P protein